MSELDVRRKILDLLSDGKIDADQATDLLRTVGGVGASQDAQVRIVDMLGEEQVSFEQTLGLLKSLASGGRRGAAGGMAPPVPPVPPVAVVHANRRSKRRGIAKVLRIHIDAGGEDGSERAKVRVNVPIALAKFAGKFLPSEAKEQLASQGIDITEILDAIGDELPDGPLVDIDAVEGDGKTRAKIVIEVA